VPSAVHQLSEGFPPGQFIGWIDQHAVDVELAPETPRRSIS